MRPRLGSDRRQQLIIVALTWIKSAVADTTRIKVPSLSEHAMLYSSLRMTVVAALISIFPPMAMAAEPIDLEGAWATDADNCGKVFVRKEGRTVLSEDSDLYGGGFTIDANRITGKMARCSITSRKNDGNTVHLLASCATDIMFSRYQFSLKVRDQNSITRIFPGMDDIEINYRRCVF
jgi:hypothetical protein